MNKKRVKRIARTRSASARNVVTKENFSLATTKVPKKVFSMVSSPTEGNISLPPMEEPEYTPPISDTYMAPVNSGYTPPVNNDETGAFNPSNDIPSDVSEVQNPPTVVGEGKGMVEKALAIGSVFLVGAKLFSMMKKSKKGVSKTGDSKGDG